MGLLRRANQAIRDEGYQQLECEIVMFVNGVTKARPGDDLNTTSTESKDHE
jgi:hypothetical protein